MDENTARIMNAANILVARRLADEPGPGLNATYRPSDITTALKIQAAVTRLLGETVAGWKCGLPVGDRVILAPIHENSICRTESCSVRPRNGQVRIEPEIAFVLGQDLPTRSNPYSTAEVDAAISRTHIALELIGSRYTDPSAVSYEEHLADSLLNEGLVIGPQVDSEAARLTGAMPLRIRIGTGIATELDGAHPNGAPRAPLYWLAEFLRSHGQGLRAGEVVITGSYASSFDVPAGQDITIQYGSLGELAIRFLLG
jgi:2-keto-4-pentenoate hydratase